MAVLSNTKKVATVKELVSKLTTKKKKDTTKEAVPWKQIAIDSNIPLHQSYFNGSLYEIIEKAALETPNAVAFTFMGRKTKYKKFKDNIEKCAKALKVIGVRENDCVLIAMPNCPQAMYMFYAVNLVGGIANMVHPLSAEKEIENYLNMSSSVTAITLDQFYHKFENIRANTKLNNIIIASIKDEVSKKIRAGYMLAEGFKIKKIPKHAPVIRWKQFMRLSRCCFYNYRVKRKPDDSAVILYSGGTTGTTKGVVLTNRNFNTLAKQIITSNPMTSKGDKLLAAMPIFHGFGLGYIHSMLANGLECVLIPRFTPKTYAKQIIRHKTNFIAGVPTLFEGLLKASALDNKNLSFLKGAFCGGDSLSNELKTRIDKFLLDHKANIQVREGYGATETVGACCLTPPNMYRPGSIGIPFPDTYFKIVKPNTSRELKFNETGEIVISGPTVMKEYWNNPKETKKALRKHSDGKIWLYTGDLGSMDEDGFIYFKGREKRMIISSGYNIYPSQLENVFDAYPGVRMSCVIGVPDPYKMHKVKAFIVLRNKNDKSESLKEDLMKYARKHLAKYEMPYDIEFVDSLPKTIIGKIAYRELEKQELKKLQK